MKTPRLLLALGLLSAFLRLSAAPVDSRISAVTVYQDRAVVTRTATVQLSGGTAELIFAHLPQALNEQSLQVSGKGTAQASILDVSAKQTYVDYTPDARVKELEDQLKAFAKQMRGYDDRANLLNTQQAMLDRMEAALFALPTKDVPRPELNQFTTSLNFLIEQKSKLVTERATLDEQREELQNRANTVQAQLQELRGAGGKAFKTVTVRVAAAQAGSLEVALSYTVPGASWVPSYDARVASSERTVQLDYFGIVRQGTGEDWKDVALTLSTARPSLGGAAPVLSVWQLDLYNPIALREQAERSRRNDMMMAKAAAAPSVNMQTLTTNGVGNEADFELKDARYSSATIEAGATSASFKIAVSSSIPSDNSPQKVPVTSAALKAVPEYLTVPKRQTAAFLTSKVVNSSEFPLLAGAMNVFLDGTFVATSGLRTVMSGEKFDLALGVDDGIAIKHKRVQKFTEDTGLTNSGKRITYEYLITVQNNKKTMERVIVADQVPLSRNEKIVVKLLSPDAKDVKPTDEGTLKWTLDLKPGEKRELTVKFTVEYDNTVNVAGLE
ncbi:mucoidy inhibitor MuiA family protein [Oleiharenicola lentus]|uniref:Mucoidy inhibitor MuiA family protein n=1 Tax=Oleiharenicola lentus TaxID=2508720 RepID=A0A4Q1C6X2_9BACT|nr:mucoidy inhibitor MuiA family protein [Oleiharenicola lentus]RXK54492.1 mucoidy inhibitor MuiA family protein [Oleiharenicola lentus]